MAASKEFLNKYLIYNSFGLKKMLRGKELEDVLDKFEHLTSPYLWNTIKTTTEEEPMVASWQGNGTLQLNTSTATSF